LNPPSSGRPIYVPTGVDVFGTLKTPPKTGPHVRPRDTKQDPQEPAPGKKPIPTIEELSGTPGE
jgi:hypothetical protein